MRARLFRTRIGESVTRFKTMNLAVQLRTCLLESHRPDDHVLSSSAEFPLLVGLFDRITAVCAKSDKEHFRRPMVGERPRIEVPMMNVARIPPEKMRIPVQLG